MSSMSNPEWATAESPWTFGWRLRWTLEHAGLSLDQAGEVVEVSASTVGRWCRDEAEPKRIFKNAIALRCGVRPDWLTDGDGHPLYPDNDGNVPPKVGEGVGEVPTTVPGGPDNHSYGQAA